MKCVSQMTDNTPDPVTTSLWMASSEVDQKALGNFAAVMAFENPLLSAMLYKILGLSVMLSKKLLRARRLRRLDTTRETKSLQLYHHIIWLSQEGLFILEGYILPMVSAYVELKVLAYKLRASFYHIFVLFHNRPLILTPVTQTPRPPPISKHDSIYGPDSFSTLANPPSQQHQHQYQTPNQRPTSKTASSHPPGLPVHPPNRPTTTTLLPPLDYTTTATACFNHAALLADKLLPGSHPLRLSVKLEYAAYLHDCLHDAVASRRLAKHAIADVYNAQEGMDDESFEDAAEIVGVLGKMVKRAGKVGRGASLASLGGESERGSRWSSERSPSLLDTSVPTTVSPVPVSKPVVRVAGSTTGMGGGGGGAGQGGGGVKPAVPSVTMVNPI